MSSSPTAASAASAAKSTAVDKPIFNDKEIKLIVAAMVSLKTGLPEIDYTRFQKNGNFNTLKTAQNTWCVLKKKILEINPEAADAAKASTPQKLKATPKKRTKKESDDSENEDEAEKGSVAKKAKTPSKKKDADFDVAGNDNDEAEESSSMEKKKKKKSPTAKSVTKKATKKKADDPFMDPADSDKAKDGTPNNASE